jgi:hypothetical protein
LTQTGGTINSDIESNIGDNYLRLNTSDIE